VRPNCVPVQNLQRCPQQRCAANERCPNAVRRRYEEVLEQPPALPPLQPGDVLGVCERITADFKQG